MVTYNPYSLQQLHSSSTCVADWWLFLTYVNLLVLGYLYFECDGKQKRILDTNVSKQQEE